MPLGFIPVTHNWASRNICWLDENIRARSRIRTSLRSRRGPQAPVLVRAGSPHKPGLAVAMSVAGTQQHWRGLWGMSGDFSQRWGAPGLLLPQPPHLGEAQLVSARAVPLPTQQGTLDMLTMVTPPRPLPGCVPAWAWE